MGYIIKAAPMASEYEHIEGDHALICARIDELAGRSIGAYIIGQLARGEREYVYVATTRNAPAVAMFGVRGFVVGRA